MSRVGPHLTTVDEIKCCSICQKQFPEDSKPSISKAFATHVREEHKKAEPAKLQSENAGRKFKEIRPGAALASGQKP